MYFIFISLNENFDVTGVFAPTDVIVSSDGQVHWYTTSYFFSSCEINVEKFPMDTQVCPVMFGSPTSTIERLVLTVGSTIPIKHADRYFTNGQWDLIDTYAESKITDIHQGNSSYYIITYFLKLKRKPLFYIYNLLFPGLLVTIIGSLVFLVPPQSGEKVGLSITALLTMMVFQLVIMDFSPETSQAIPLLGSYLFDIFRP